MKEMLRRPVVSKRTGYQRSTLYKHIQIGLFPPPVAMGARCSTWPSDEVDAIIQARIAGKSDDEIREIVRQLVVARKSAA